MELLIHEARLSQPDAPLVLMVHGRGGNRRVMKPFVRCLPQGCNVVFPEAPFPDAEGGGFSWWPASSDDFRGEANSSAGRLSGFIAGAQAHYALRPRTIVALGFSQGAAILSLLFQLGPGLLSAAALLSGFVIETETAIAGIAPIPVCVCHGTNDPTVPVERARRGAEYLRARGYSVDYFEDDAAHKIGASNLRELTAWLKARI